MTRDLRARRKLAQLGQRKFGGAFDKSADLEAPVDELVARECLVALVVGILGSVWPEMG